MKHRRTQPDVLTPAHAAGTTLTEVLVSILALGIGAVLVASIFPVSVVKSINATKLTRGTIHRFNAESYVDMLPMRMVHNPNFNFVGNTIVHNTREHYGRNYVVDPLGWHQATAGLRNRFGNGGRRGLTRFNAGLNRFDADEVVSSSDSWPKPDGFEDQYTVTAFTTTSVTLDGIGAADLSQVDVSAAGRSRIVLFDGTGRFSHVRMISPNGVSGVTVGWGAAVPANFLPVTARIESRDRHFTWLLTVRNRGRRRAGSPLNDTLSADVDVVVFFKRRFTQQVERVFTLQRASRTSRRVYRVVIPPGSTRPLLKKGLYICDVVNARWHRIQRIANETSNLPLIWLETEPPRTQIVTQAILMPGVVEVYPLGTKDNVPPILQP